MPDFEQRIEAKLDRVSEALSEQSETLIRNTVTLEEHVRRTNILEARIDPLTAAHQRWVGAGKAFAMVGAAVAALGSLAAVTEAFLHVLGHVK